MQVIQEDQDQHNGSNYTSSYFFIIAYTQIGTEIDEDSPDEDERKALQVVQDRDNGLNYIYIADRK